MSARERYFFGAVIFWEKMRVVLNLLVITAMALYWLFWNPIVLEMLGITGAMLLLLYVNILFTVAYPAEMICVFLFGWTSLNLLRKVLFLTLCAITICLLLNSLQFLGFGPS